MKQLEEIDSIRKDILAVIDKHFHACNHVRFLKSFRLSVDKKTNEIKGCEMEWYHPKQKANEPIR